MPPFVDVLNGFIVSTIALVLSRFITYFVQLHDKLSLINHIFQLSKSINLQE